MSSPDTRTDTASPAGLPWWRRRAVPLYLQIWLAVVLAVVVLSVVFWALWRANLDQIPPRQVIIRNEAGEIIGQAVTRAVRLPGFGVEFQVPTRDGRTLHVQLPLRPRPPGERPGDRPGGSGPGGEPGPRPLLRGPFTLSWTLAIVAVAVTLGLYPIIRRLTRRLEALEQGATRWAAGDLTVRVPVSGGDEVGRLAERFNHAAERVQSLVVSHKSLLANASHELRSPLARIRMAVELMHTAPSEALRSELTRNIAELDQIIDEILLASRLDAQADFGADERVDFTALVAEECARTGVALDLEGGRADASIEVQGAPRLLRRMVRNLVENALRHGAHGGADGVNVTLARHESHVILRVADRGPGVPLAERERIFEPFYRSAGASEIAGGVGLGLALVRQIARRHGGDASCQARDGGGACFDVRLPLADFPN